MEEWRKIDDKGKYEVSSYGRIRSWYYHKQWQDVPLYRTFFTSGKGYVYCRMYLEDTPKNYAVHRLVLSAFIGESILEPNHKDGNKHNNRLDNLEYMTHRENVQHSFKQLGRVVKYGENATHSKLSNKQIEEIRDLLFVHGWRNVDVAREYNISREYVSNIKRGKTRTKG